MIASASPRLHAPLVNERAGLVAYAVSKFTSGSLVVAISAVGIVGFVTALVIIESK